MRSSFDKSSTGGTVVDDSARLLGVRSSWSKRLQSLTDFTPLDHDRPDTRSYGIEVTRW